MSGSINASSQYTMNSPVRRIPKAKLRESGGESIWSAEGNKQGEQEIDALPGDQQWNF